MRTPHVLFACTSTSMYAHDHAREYRGRITGHGESPAPVGYAPELKSDEFADVISALVTMPGIQFRCTRLLKLSWGAAAGPRDHRQFTRCTKCVCRGQDIDPEKQFCSARGIVTSRGPDLTSQNSTASLSIRRVPT